MGNSARLFVELIHKASGDSYPNWVPSKPVKVGDFGEINKETGQFETDGSIYDPEFEPDLRISERYPVTPCPPEDIYMIASRGFKQKSISANVALPSPVMESTIKGAWTISRGRGAIVVLYKPKVSVIKDLGDLQRRIRAVEALANKALVTMVHSCPMYALLLTDDASASAEASVGLVVPSAAPVTAGAQAKWSLYSSNGVWRSGGGEGDGTYYPLFTLHTPKVKSFMDIAFGRRSSYPEETIGEPFELYRPPWSLLDENGDEVVDQEEDEEE